MSMKPDEFAGSRVIVRLPLNYKGLEGTILSSLSDGSFVVQLDQDSEQIILSKHELEIK